MKTTKEEIRQRYVVINSYWDGWKWTWTESEKNLILIEWKLVNGIAEEIVLNTNIVDRKELIDYIYADGVEEVFEHFLRKNYLNN